MAKGEQDEDQATPQEVMKAVLKPFGDAIDALAKGQTANQKAIKALAQQKQEPMIPPEITKLLPGLIQGVIKIFTQPETDPGAASKGIFGDDMMKSYKASMERGWKLNNDMLEANIKKINVDIAAMNKRLKDEI